MGLEEGLQSTPDLHVPRVAKELKAIELNRLSPGRHAVGGAPGLLLQVPDPGKSLADGKARTRSVWVLRVTVAGKRREIGLGGYPEVSLADARERAREYRRAIFEGKDPLEEKRAERAAIEAARASAVTFKRAAEGYLKSNEVAWKNAKHAAQWRATLDTYVYPVLGAVVVRDVGVGHVMRVLEPIWTSKTETASRVRGRIESILSYASARGYRSGDNPARWRGHLELLLPKPSKVARVKHHEAIPYRDAPAFWRRLEPETATGSLALKFTILTAARSGEVRGARWRELDLEEAVWIVPADRMKAGREHRVPLSQAAINELRLVPKGEPGDLVFPGSKGRPLSDMTLGAVLKRMKVQATVHGFRSTFRDWVAEQTNYPNEVAEMALAHTVANKSEASYRRGDLFEKRRSMMADWAAYLASTDASRG